MKWKPEKLQKVFDRTSGKCHICHKPLEYCSYGNAKSTRGWEVEHSIPRSNGGTDTLNNLYPAHVSCNRSKGVKTSLAMRQKFGKKRAPLSKLKRRETKIDSGLWNGIGMALFSTVLRLNPTTGAILTVATAVVSFLKDPDDYE